jgi:hypothetical protein
MKTHFKRSITVVVFTGLLVFLCWKLYSQHASHAIQMEQYRQDISHLASLNARMDIFRGSMYSYAYGMVDGEVDESLRKEMSKYNVIPVNMGCELYATEYTLSYNQVIREHLIKTHGMDPIHEFSEKRKGTSDTRK